MITIAIAMAMQVATPAWFNHTREVEDWAYLDTTINQQIVALTQPGDAADEIIMRVEFMHPTQGALSGVIRKQVDCNRGRMRQLAVWDFSQPNLEGEIVKEDLKEYRWSRPAQGSLDHIAFNRACNIAQVQQPPRQGPSILDQILGRVIKEALPF